MAIRWENIEELLGFTITSVEVKKDCQYDEIHFSRADGKTVIMYHAQDCCETVEVNDIDGDLDDIVGSPVIEAEVASREAEAGEVSDEAGTWTYYKIGTSKGCVSIRWLGESNGWYSEEVSIRVE